MAAPPSGPYPAAGRDAPPRSAWNGLHTLASPSFALASPAGSWGGNFLRSLVSKKKRRFRQDGFDLDLTCAAAERRAATWMRPRLPSHAPFRAPIAAPVLAYPKTSRTASSPWDSPPSVLRACTAIRCATFAPSSSAATETTTASTTCAPGLSRTLPQSRAHTARAPRSGRGGRALVPSPFGAHFAAPWPPQVLRAGVPERALQPQGCDTARCCVTRPASDPFLLAVARYPFDDHNPPPMGLFLPFCRDVVRFLPPHLPAPAPRASGDEGYCRCSLRRRGSGRTRAMWPSYTARRARAARES